METCLCQSISQLARQNDDSRAGSLVSALNEHLSDLRALLCQSKTLAQSLRYRITPNIPRTSKVFDVDFIDLTALDRIVDEFSSNLDKFWTTSSPLVHSDLRRRVASVVVFLLSKLDAESPPSLLDSDPEDDLSQSSPGPAKQNEATRLPSIWTRKVVLNMAQRFLQSLHVSAFNSIFFSLLPAPQADGHDFRLPFRFSGGLGLSSKKMGLANTTIGMIGIPLQLLVYPRLIGRLGVKGSYQLFLPVGIAAYFLVPYLVLLPAERATLVWTCLSAVLSMQVLSRTFVNPATVMLVNDCAPTPERLGTIHGLAQSISSAARILGPTIGGTVLGWGLGHNFVGLPLWLLAIIALANWLVVMGIEDVDMHH